MTDRSAEPADLFVQIYDELPDAAFRGWSATRWYRDPEVRRRASEIEELVLAFGELDPEHVEEAVEAGGDRGRFAVLLGLDAALAHANPYGPHHDAAALSGTVVRYLTEGRFNTAATSGALLPRCAFPGRPGGRRGREGFFGVHRVTAEQWAKVEHRVVPAVHDAHFNRDEPVAVGCAPLLESFDDIEVEFEERHGTTVYRMRPRDSSKLRARIRTVMRHLDAAGAQVAVMPELSLSDGLLEHWKEVAFDTAGRDRDRHPLRYLLLGSGPLGPGDPPPNRAVLLDRWTGSELLVQDKLSGFTLDAAQMRLWRLPGAPDRGVAEEYLEPGGGVRLLDMSLGRISVLICEDLSDSVGWERELRACGVSHLMVPILSKPVLRFRWEQQAAERQIAALGAWVTVSNSLVIGDAIPPDDLEGTRYTALVAGPGDLERDTYAADLQFARASAGDQLARVDPGGALPAVLPGAAYALWHDHWSA